jgi:hypothetical protein
MASCSLLATVYCCFHFVCCVQLNGTSAEGLSLSEAKKQMDKSKDKLQLVISRSAGQLKTYASLPRDRIDTTGMRLIG